MSVLLGILKTQPAGKLSLASRHMEDRHLPLFRENQNPEALFNSDGEQDIGNPLSHGENLGDGIILPAI